MFFPFLDFLIFGFVDFGIFSFWILRPVDIWKPGSVFPCTVGARVEECYDPYMHHIYTHIHTHVHEHAPLAKPGFCSGGRISCKLSTSINKNDDSNSPIIIVHCLVPVLIATMIVSVLVPVWIYQR